VPGRLVLVVPADLQSPTGGNRYDLAVTTALRELGVEIELRPAPGDWPVARAPDRDRLAGLLWDDDPVLVDGLLACGAPEAVATAVAAGSRVHVLVHLPLALESGLDPATVAQRNTLEQRALRAATGVLATSRWTAAELRDRHGCRDVVVASAGTEHAAASEGSNPPRLLCLAPLTPLKNQLTLVEALALLTDLPWTAHLTGSLDVDPQYAAQVRTAIAGHALGDRVVLTGPVSGQAWHAAWAAADLLLLASWTETWGMVVTEALARGVPAVVPLGTGAQEALGRTPDGTLPGSVVPAGDPARYAAAIRDLLGPGRDGARRAARIRAAQLRSWTDTAQDVLRAVR
jgi:Glycosyl transferases group 1